MKYAVAVIDIGMTNKKVAVYDDALAQISACYRNFPPRMVDGRETHDLEAMEAWFIEELAKAAGTYPVKALAVTTHGATFVCVGRDGKPSAPCVYYTYEPGDAFHDRFYALFGAPESLQERTGTPAFKALINPAKGILFLKETYPELFENTAHLLLYPQYWGYRFTGKAGAEGTYMGCHSYLWDQVEHRLSSVAEGLGAASRMPGKIGNSWDILGTVTEAFAQKTGLDRDVIVTLGIHDSNSSLLPHFAKKRATGFVLNSTGTWCVIMNPVKAYGFTQDELGKVVFFNISAFGGPIKTAIFQGGKEFEIWSALLMKLHNRNDVPSYNRDLYGAVLAGGGAFLLPELVAGSGQFPGSRARVVEAGVEYPYEDIASGTALPPSFKNYERGVALLRISLVMQTITALERTGVSCAGSPRGAADSPGDVFIEGGFRKDEAYNALVSAYLKDQRVYLTDIAEATALGAAMTAKMALTGASLAELARDFDIEYQEVAKTDMPEIFPYREAWLSRIYGPASPH
ncbi:MAG: carbohydrate kinase [Spirochaetaceae bacterium]|jgi:sugar (pentulose or hexulose) kinase|nr:carbohydrate kinase [Spirochaetaceae bacterium]